MKKLLLLTLVLAACHKDKTSNPSQSSPPPQASNYDTLKMVETCSNKDTIGGFIFDLATFGNPPGAIPIKERFLFTEIVAGDTIPNYAIDTIGTTAIGYVIYKNAVGDSIGLWATIAVTAKHSNLKIYENSKLLFNDSLPIVYSYGSCRQIYLPIKI